MNHLGSSVKTNHAIDTALQLVHYFLYRVRLNQTGGNVKLTARAGCLDGNCEKVYTAEDGRVGVRGTLITEPETLAQLQEMPAHEGVVLVTQELLIEYLRNVGALR